MNSLVIAASLTFVTALALSSLGVEPVSAAQARRDAELGVHEATVQSQRQAAETLHQAGDAVGESRALLDLGAAYQRLGQVRLAIQTFERVVALAGEAEAPELKLKAEAALGAAQTFSKQADEAEPRLREALGMARESGDAQVAARVLNDLGNLLSARRQFAPAADAYREAAQFARRAGDHLLAAKALLNRAGTAVAGGEKSAANLTREGLQETHALPDSPSKAMLLLAGATHLQKSGDPAALNEALVAAREAFRLARHFNDERTMADALGGIGALYETERRYPEALRATREALLHAQAGQMPEPQYRWAWQEGRLLAAQGERKEAIAAYRRAVASADAIRHDLAIGFGNANRGSSFREALGPLFLQFADLLLQQSGEETDSEKVQSSLREVRDTVELLKSAELVDYFQDDCVNLLRSRTAGIEQVSPSAAIIYLLPLPARTELLVGLSDGWKRFQVPMGEIELTKVIRTFRKNLETRTSYEYLTQGRKLYDCLVRPLESTLTKHAIDTLVFVPDGALRTIPFGALHDGERFLIDRYAVAVTPGTTLTDPRAVERKSAQLLLGGLSDPVQGFLPLGRVPGELDAIHKLFGGTTLLDHQFSSARIAAKFDGEQYSIVHLASHGRFDHDARKTFILTHDSKLSLDDLERLIRPSQFHGRPVELVTLSACQSAAGDDRAALGMAGVAVKSGARSAVASLWFVNDQSSTELLSAFYQNLWQDPTLSKAQAMRKAQLSLLATRTYQHPCYWAPYLVIGNWL